MPLISVIMPAYNCASFVRAAVDSIIGQTETDWELIILDDCSTDNTLEVLLSIRDRRICIVQSEKNLGQANQMNKGIRMAKGEFIAIAHADDINERNRLEEQLKLFRKNSAIGVVGAWIKYIGEREGFWESPVGAENCLVKMLDDSPIAHPTAMMRASVLKDLICLYRQDFVPAEDYELWARLSAITKFDNVPLFLVNYRFHLSQISKRKEAELMNKVEKVKSIFLQHNFGSLDPHHRMLLLHLITLMPGSYVTREMIFTSKRLFGELAATTGIEGAKWKKKLLELLFRALLTTKHYEPGAGIYFLWLYPAQVFFKKPSDIARIIWRSFKIKNSVV
jgi:glycosyltransferase involved in cell wall biosynthesis